MIWVLCKDTRSQGDQPLLKSHSLLKFPAVCVGKCHQDALRVARMRKYILRLYLSVFINSFLFPRLFGISPASIPLGGCWNPFGGPRVDLGTCRGPVVSWERQAAILAVVPLPRAWVCHQPSWPCWAVSQRCWRLRPQSKEITKAELLQLSPQQGLNGKYLTRRTPYPLLVRIKLIHLF